VSPHTRSALRPDRDTVDSRPRPKPGALAS
jgi:hypothetical protein